MSALDDDYTLRLWNVNDKIVQELVSYFSPVTFLLDSIA